MSHENLLLDTIKLVADTFDYYPTAPRRVRQITCIIVHLFGQLVILYCKKTCLTTQLCALSFSIHFAFLAL